MSTCNKSPVDDFIAQKILYEFIVFFLVQNILKKTRNLNVLSLYEMYFPNFSLKVFSKKLLTIYEMPI